MVILGVKRKSQAHDNKIKRIFRKLFIAFGIIILVFILFGGDNGIIRVWQLSKQIDNAKYKVDYLRIKNVDLLRERNLLLHDVKYRKLVATERYGMVSKGTVMCRVVK